MVAVLIEAAAIVNVVVTEPVKLPVPVTVAFAVPTFTLFA